MSRHISPALFGASLAVLSVSMALLSATGLSAQPASATKTDRPVKANPPVVFAQTQSDLPADPAVRFGKLANGMTYVIYKNKTPPGAASVWMRVAAGSVMEQEKQRGLAHFIEHMAFNGSKNVPEGDMVKILQRDGLQFGADTNAQTEGFQTVYKLNLPDASERILGDALFLMRETAGNITFNPAAIDRERGVILGEERARATPDYRAFEASLKTLFPGSKYAERMPIGLVDVIKTAQRPEFVRFYTDFYRPEYTTMIIVGDVDADKVEADIRRRFMDWRPAPASKSALTDYGKVAERSTSQAAAFTAAGLANTFSVSWVAQPKDGVETKATDFSEKLFSIANGILDERFARIANTPTSPFLGAGLQKDSIAHTAQTYSLIIAPKEGQDKAAVELAGLTLREYLANGPTRAELDRALEAFDRRYHQGAAAAGKIPTQALASLVVDALATQGVVQSPAQSLSQWEAAKPAVTLAAIRKVLAPVMSGSPPILWRQGEQDKPFDRAAMLATWQEAMKRPIETVADRKTASWPYTSFGQPSAVISRQPVADTGATRVTFANGVILNVKHTDFEDNTVHVAVQVGNGLMGVRSDQGAALFMAKQTGPIEGGLGKLSSDDVREALAGRTYGLGMNFGNDATQLMGSTTTTDLPIQLQVLAAFISDPGLRPEALDRIKTALPSAYASGAGSPDGIYALHVPGDLYGEDPRFTVPRQQDALAVTNDAVSAIVRDQMRGPIEVTIVGDVSPDEAIRQVAATLGALPQVPAVKSVAGADRIAFPTTNLRRTYSHNGRDDQNLSIIAWPTVDYSDPRRATTLELLASVMTLRELDQVREKEGATYSASAGSVSSRYFPGFGYILSRATVRPDADESYFATVSGIADVLKRSPVTRDELNRARLPLIDRLRNEKNGNGYWLALLAGSVRDPKQIATIESRERNLASVTPQDIQQAARSYLDMGKALRIQIKPK